MLVGGQPLGMVFDFSEGRPMIKYRIENEADRKMAMARLTGLPAGEGWKVDFLKSEKRREVLNRLSWRWYTAIGEQTFQSKEEVHDEAKLTLGVPILCRDEPDFATMWARLAERFPTYDEQLKIIEYIDVTRIMSDTQMREYLTDMEHHYERGAGIQLPRKDDEYREALGYTEREKPGEQDD